MYHIAFQLLGDIWMLLGLLVMAFAPMATWHQFCPAPSDGIYGTISFRHCCVAH
jgi:hypothetical protein